MRRFYENKPLIFLIAATVAAIIIIGVMSNVDRDASLAENAGGTVVTPVHGAVTGIGKWFGSIAGYFGNVKSLKSENESLKNENTSLQKRINDMQGLQSENDRLKKMLSLREKSVDITMVAANVYAKDPSNWYSSFTLSKGSKDGFKKNQPVVDGERNLVGQISEVGENWAKVITILDPQSSVGVIVKRSNEIGILEGNSNLRYEGKCRLGYIARDTDVQNGDFLETSGLGGVFPRGLVVGKVIEVHDENATMSRAASVEPLANIKKLSEVFVITSYKEADLSVSDTNDEADDDEYETDSDLYDDEDDE